MKNFFDKIIEALKQPIWLICIASALILVLAIVFLLIQWKRVSRQKHYPKIVDHTVNAKHDIEQARAMIEYGLLKSIRNEFGNTVPDDSSALQTFVSDAYGLRAGGLYIAVDSLASFVHQLPSVYLQGSDNVGGESVLPLKVSESGERYFYLEGLSICYRNEATRYSVSYNIRFSLEKSGRPIEEVLEFEVV